MFFSTNQISVNFCRPTALRIRLWFCTLFYQYILCFCRLVLVDFKEDTKNFSGGEHSMNSAGAKLENTKFAVKHSFG